MKYLLYYNLDDKFVTDQVAVGGDGTKVVSVVDGVAWTKDQEKTYYRYSSNSGDVITYNVTIKYRSTLFETIANDDIITISAYSGCDANVFVLPKNIEFYKAIDESGNTVSGVSINVSGNTTYTFRYLATDFSRSPLHFEITSPGYIVWGISSGSVASAKTISYKKNADNWVSITAKSGDNAAKINVVTGDIVQFVGDNQYYGTWTFIGNSFCGTTAGFKVKGNIMSLLSSSGYNELEFVVSADTFSDLFNSCTGLTDASELCLPVLNINGVRGVYRKMFSNCTNLISAPVLPATVVDGWLCYGSMFSHCTSLRKAPDLPAMTLGAGCYETMFSGCTSLSAAPELPATTLKSSCYYRMFYGCISLTVAPSLPATTLAEYCYGGMFGGCTSLTQAPELPATTLAEYCYAEMFYGCTSLTSAPSLPATTLAQDCYYNMFRGCTSLTQAPELPATNVPSEAYCQMFWGCSSLSFIKCLGIYRHGDATMSWVPDVAENGTFIKHPDASWPTGASGIPEGWTVQDATD